MSKLVEPAVFLIGQTAADPEQVKRWLAHVGVSEEGLRKLAADIDDEGWDGEHKTPPLPPAEAVVALAAKRCYMSFEPGLNPNVTRVREDYAEYFENILKVGHGSVLEHSVFNFAIEGVSRVFTAEMNRHRAGWAISEGSMRFIRFGEAIPYWVPTSFQGPDVLDETYLRLGGQTQEAILGNAIKRPSPTDVTLDERKHASRVIMAHVFEHVRQMYRVLEAIWDMDSSDKDFAYKKAVTSAMRRIVPMGVATGGVWSGNVRALRHVLTMRCEPAAEEEILFVFSRVAKMMAEQHPMLFGDFYQDDQGFWRPKYRKV